MNKKDSNNNKERKLPNSYQKNLEHFKLLAEDSDFKKDIRKIRKKINIPEGGFSKADKILDWYEKDMIEKSDEIEASEEFKKEIEKLHEKIEEENLSGKEVKRKSRKIHAKIPINFFTYRVEFLIDKYNLPLNFRDTIRNYIIDNSLRIPVQNFSKGSYQAGEKPSDSEYLPIKIYTKLTEKEFKDLKEFIKRKSKHLPKYQKLKNIDRDLKIKKWYENKEKIDLVNQENYKMTNKEIAENILGDKTKGRQIPRIVKDTKKKIKKRFKEN